MPEFSELKCYFATVDYDKFAFEEKMQRFIFNVMI